MFLPLFLTMFRLDALVGLEVKELVGLEVKALVGLEVKATTPYPMH